MDFVSQQQKNLDEVYQGWWPALQSQLSKVPSDGVSWPFLLNVEAHYFLTVPVRLLIVLRQEGRGTWDGRGPTEGVLESLYKSYAEDVRFRLKARTGHLCTAVDELQRRISPTLPLNSFALSALIKVTQGGKRPTKAVEGAVLKGFNVLPSEIEILQPNVVVFFTGSTYDGVLKKVFDDVSLEPVPGRVSLDRLAVVKHPGLPPHSYRTLDPVGMTLAGQRRLLLRIGDLVTGKREGVGI